MTTLHYYSLYWLYYRYIAIHQTVRYWPQGIKSHKLICHTYYIINKTVIHMLEIIGTLEKLLVIVAPMLKQPI